MQEENRNNKTLSLSIHRMMNLIPEIRLTHRFVTAFQMCKAYAAIPCAYPLSTGPYTKY